MPPGFGRLPFLARRGAATGPSRFEESAEADPGIDDDDAPVGPPVLLPAMIHRMILIDATELTPVWARPRPPQPAGIAPLTPTAGAAKPDPAAASANAPAPKPPRRRKASGTADEPKAPSAPRSPRKPAGSRRRTS